MHSLYLVERVVFAFHISVANTFAKNVLVKGASKVTLEQFVVVDGLGNNAADKLEVAQMIRVAVRGRIDHVRHSIAR